MIKTTIGKPSFQKENNISTLDVAFWGIHPIKILKKKKKKKIELNLWGKYPIISNSCTHYSAPARILGQRGAG